MTLKNIITGLLLFFAGSTSMAAAKVQPSQKQIENRAALFLLKKSEASLQSRQTFNRESDRLDRCDDQQPGDMSCVQYVAGNWSPTTEQRAEAARSCVGNRNDICVKYVGGDWSPTFEQRTAAARSCRNNQNSDCANYVAGNWSPSFEERTTAASACQNADVECVKYTAGNWSPDFQTRVNAAKACGGN
jgi:hypothetical protein